MSTKKHIPYIDIPMRYKSIGFSKFPNTANTVIITQELDSFKNWLLGSGIDISGQGGKIREGRSFTLHLQQRRRMEL